MLQPRRHSYFALVLFISIISPDVLLASDSPPLPTIVPPQAVAPPAKPPTFMPLRAPYRPPQTKAELDAIGYSSSVYLQRLALLQRYVRAATASATTTASGGGTARDAVGPPRFMFGHSASVLDTTGPTIINNPPDINQDKEPFYMTVHNGLTHIEKQYAAWIFYDSFTDASNFHVKASTNTGAGWSPSTILNGPRTLSGDPYLASNNYVSGFNPQTVYCAHISYNLPDESAIALWRNSSGSWIYDEVPDVHNVTTDGLFTDKPSIDVNQWQDLAGAVYVAYMRVQTQRCVNPPYDCPTAPSLGFALYDAGGWHLRTDVPTPVRPPGSWDAINSAIVVSDPLNGVGGPYGSVYVLYLDWTTNQIFVYLTDDEGLSWELMSSLNANDYGIYFGFPGGRDPRICSNRLNNDCIFAPTTLAARFNWHSDSCTSSRSIGMVLNAWDGPDPNTAHMHSYFLRWNPWMQCSGGGRGFDKIVQLPDGGLDAWDPAIDFDPSGNYVVSRYRRTDTNTLNYTTLFSYISNDGTWSHDINCPSCRVSDATRYVKHVQFGYHIGEYQGIWYTSFLNFAGAATIDIGTSEGDTAFYSVVP